jgi:2-polyprenyl-3-methyl-5-hydroxy-6-metoxy-1,4-benzoquinol methylase
MSHSREGAATQYGRRTCEDGHVEVTPMPTQEELERFYADTYYQQTASSTYQTEYSAEEVEHKRLKASVLFEALGSIFGSLPGSLLDVGSGEGFLLAASVDVGINAHGLEFDRFAIERFNPSVLERVTVGSIDASMDELRSVGRRFDVVTLQNVLEHVPDPKRTLARVRALVRGGGVIAITVPNDFSTLQAALIARRHVDREYWFAPPQHLHYFNSETVVRFFADSGYRVVDAFSDFPVEFFLAHPGSNYSRRPEAGKPAHRARVFLDLLLAQRGVGPYLAWARALFGCGMGRDFTLLVRPADGDFED